MERVGENNNDVKFVTKPHSVKLLLLANDSLHVPSHVLLTRGSLFAHSYPESLHPFETHEILSISEVTAANIAEGNHFRFDTKSSHRLRVISKQRTTKNTPRL